MMEMQSQRHKNKLYQLISSCINTFRKIPKLLQNSINGNASSSLTNLILSANNLVQLSNHITEHIPTNEEFVEVFHRFYSRLRQIIYSYLGFYIKINGKMFVRDFLVQVNKQVLNFRPDSDPTLILHKVYLCIVKFTKMIAVGQNMKNEQIQEVLKDRKLFKKRPDLPSTKQQPLYLKEKGLPKNIEVELETQKFLKNYGIDVISNIDGKYLQKLTKQPQQELMKNFTTRNRNIKMQISRYSANYDLFQNKPQQKKNRSMSSFQPSRVKPATGRKKSKQRKLSRQRNSMSLRKNPSIYQSITYQNTSDQVIRQELLQQITQRKKCCPAKVIIAGSDLSFKPVPSHSKNLKGQSSSKFYKRSKKGAKIGFQLYSQATRHNSISFAN